MNAKWSVLTLYRDMTARQSAVQFCGALVQKFWPEKNFTLDWLDWNSFVTADSAHQGDLKVLQADIILVAMAETGTMDTRLSKCLEVALTRRREREGILVGLSAPDGAVTPESAATQQYLRRLAHENGLDYLTGLPQSLPHSVSETIETCMSRATQVSSVLDRILHCIPPPPRML